MTCHGMKPALRGALAALMLSALALPALAHPRHWPHRHREGHTRIVAPARGKPVRTTVFVNKHRFAAVDVNVKPKQTELWVDGLYHGNCDGYDGSPDKLYLLPGRHTLTLVTPDGVEVERELVVKAGERRELGLDLR